MSEANHLAVAVQDFYSNPDNNWFMPIAEGIKGLTAEQAAAIPAKGFNSVWAVVNHVRFCQEVILNRLKGESEEHTTFGEGEDWPPVGDPLDEGAWNEACAKALEVNQEFAKVVAAIKPEMLEKPWKPGKAERWKMIQGIIAHNSYHACEIISIRHMQGLWLEEV